LEPPETKTIQKSYESLHKSYFITNPTDQSEITNLGSFVVTLGVDLLFGSLIGLGIQFGVGVEAIQLAAVLSFPNTPWIMSNPLIHSPQSYNGNYPFSVLLSLLRH
jgi:HrpA-like RNA helicase